MATINVAKRRIDAKIVYYGPAQSGKTTNVVNIHARLPEPFRGPLRSIDTVEERTLFFDFMPVQAIDVGGWSIRFHLYSVPGQADYVRTRRAILGGADGIVFVADASPSAAAANIASADELRTHLGHYQRTEASLPITVQVNKRDLPDARDVEVVAADLGLPAAPVIEGMAIRGIGVAETLGIIAKAVARGL